MDLKGNEEVKQFLGQVCTQVKWREVREEVALELESHILEIAEECLEDGLSKEEAVSRAVERMGEAEVVGRQLNKVHKPRPDLSLVGITLLLTLLGLAVIYVMPKGNLDTFTESLKVILPGILLAGALYFLDYRLILPYSKYVFAGVLAFLALFAKIDLDFQYSAYRIMLDGVIFPLLMVSIVGILHDWPWSTGRRFALTLFLLFTPLVFLLSAHLRVSAIIYGVTFLAIMITAGAKRWQLASTVLGQMSFCVGALMYGPPYIRNRVWVLLDPARDPHGIGWLYMRLAELRQTAGMWGQGSPWPNFTPLGHEVVLTYVIYTFGWIAAFAIMVVIAAFLWRMLVLVFQTRNSYGRLLATAISSVFITKFMLNILMNLGFFPISQLGLPFISFGRVDFIVNMMLVGLMLSIYRRRTLKAISAKNSGHSPA